ncbi:hypothetical protein L6164_024833 [Bauhinia variegata]|uniref:Uncharacterized protein n=1 Tax=Bauhinia variegata TaxID=167791 RepID=A0ACB9LZL2_BAUVA|nr:hypothetical protein L6164_024833 [Bauhinia variegata]
MGKSTSCFKLITCGGDVVDKDDYQASEIKDSHDKRGWSFRKRSARHRVLSNTVITDTSSSANKESSECASVNFQQPENSNVVEKICTAHRSDEKPDKPQFSSVVDSQIYEPVAVTETESKADVDPVAVTEIESKADADPPESVVIIIQCAVRGFLAQRDLVKLKNVVKLQAAVRGHLVRRHAVGTLRCIQAIVKMQLLVRARHAQKLHPEKHLNQKQSKNDGLKTLGNENHMTKSNVTYTSIEKLLSNSFACQLLESTARNKSIHVKCDPSKADSAWKWLERWMSVSSTDTRELKKACSVTEQLDDSKESSSVSQLESAIRSEDFSESVDPKPIVGDPVLPSEDKEKLMTYDVDNFNFHGSHCASSIDEDNLEQALPELTVTSDVKVTSVEVDPYQNAKLPSDAIAPKDLDSLPQSTSDVNVISVEIDPHQNANLPSDASAPKDLDSFPQITSDVNVTSVEINPYQNAKLPSDASAPKDLDSLPQITSDVKITSGEIDPCQNAKLPSNASAPKNHDSLPQITSDVKITSLEIDAHQNAKLPSDASASEDLDSFSQKHEIDSEQPKRSTKRFASDQLETEAKKFVYGSRKASNPAFIVAHSKFEEVSSISNSGRSSSLSYQDEAVESQANAPSVGENIENRTKEFFSSENSTPFTSRIGGSECGTELSISSTLDSPDISEVGVTENERKCKDMAEEAICNPDITLNTDAETNITSAIPASNVPSPVLGQAETDDDINDEMAHQVVALDCEESTTQSEKLAPRLQREQTEAVVQDIQLSPEASPRSHLTVPESQGTPSSLVSAKPKESKTDKTGSNNRRKSLSSGNKSPANANHDSGSRGGNREELPKDQRNGKRRNSIGSKPDHFDEEPRDNSGNNSPLPHFMQATESARAKINANNSPRSSPDVHDRDVQVKKRHSLPGATNRQSSPRIRRSMSQAQQGRKGNGLNPPPERRWQR